jgi:hypothetical protein
MRREVTLTHEFVDYIPEKLDEGKLYVSMKYRTVGHKCCCGCGNEVFTPLGPIDWRLTFDGECVSLFPSIGNWSLPCKSHYWIDCGKAKWAARWTQRQIDAGRARDRYRWDVRYGKTAAPRPEASGLETEKPKRSLWKIIKEWLS